MPIPLNEAHRLTVLRETQILDSDYYDPEFDRITSQVARFFDVSITKSILWTYIFEL